MIHARRIFPALSLITMFGLVLSCVHEPLVPAGPEGPIVPVDQCDPNVIYFQNDILPLLVSNCAKSGCHDAATAEEDIVLDSYANVMGSDVIEAGDPEDSELYEKITENDPDDVMPPPPHERLSPDQIAQIRTWIRQGAQDTFCSNATCDTANVTYSGAIRNLITNKCLGCHSGNIPAGNLDFSTHLGLQIAALDGRLYGAVNHASGFTPMPQGGAKLSACEIDVIRIWIDDGALNN